MKSSIKNNSKIKEIISSDYTAKKTYFKRRKILLFLVSIISLILIYNIYLRINSPIGISFFENERLFLLIHANILLISVLTAVMIRYLLKLLYERQKKVLGFKLRSKLIVAFIIIGALPIMLFFYVTNDFFLAKIDQWFRPQTSITIDKTIQILQNLRDNQKKALEQLPNQLVKSLATIENNDAMVMAITEALEQQPVNGVTLYDDQGTMVYHKVFTKTADDSWKPVTKERLRQIDSSITQITDTDDINHAIRRFTANNGQVYFIEVYADEKILSKLDTAETLQDLSLLRQSFGSSRALNVNYKVMLLFISILMIFVLIWFALYLSKTIIGPIEQLLYGMAQVQLGNWDIKLHLGSERSDELRLVVSSFNHMVSELRRKSYQLKQRELQLSLSNNSLTEKNQTLETIFGSIELGALTLDTQGHIMEINNAFKELFNLPLSSNYEQGLYKKLFPKNLTAIIDEMQLILLHSDQEHLEKSINLQIKQVNVHYRIGIHRIRKKTEYGQLIVVHNLTEMNNLLRSSAWNEVARRVAHEIKNPLTPIRSNAERILNRYYYKDTKLYAPLKGMVDTIIIEVDFLKNIINEFATYARIPQISLRYSSIANIFKQLENFYKGNIPHNIKLSIGAADKIPLVNIDSNQIKQALQNLIQNSINALQDINEGTISLVASINEDPKITANKSLLITVTDNGPGIPPELIHDIFKPYVTTSKDGTGLGLPIVHRIVTEHHGLIRVSSTPYQKTTFQILLALEDPQKIKKL